MKCTWFASIVIILPAEASDGVETAGDVLQYFLPATAAGMTLVLRDGEGALQFGKSAATTLAATYSLKYAIDEQRQTAAATPTGATEPLQIWRVTQ